MKYLDEESTYTIQPQPGHKRLYQVTVTRDAAEAFFAKHPELHRVLMGQRGVFYAND